MVRNISTELMRDIEIEYGMEYQVFSSLFIEKAVCEK